MWKQAQSDSGSMPEMRNVAFYYAIGFAAAGVSMLIFTIVTLAMYAPDPWNTVALILAMILPFVVSILSWYEWTRLQKASAASEKD